ncbi:MAG TPA: hypothetical protein VLX92_10370 [Kofleriaceae bacterium]|nr:hypothetical protein [Kofleriaceae bacterium]
MRPLAIVIVALCACGTPGEGPRITGDSCALWSSSGNCSAHAGCQWLGTGCGCPPNDPSCVCGQGACVSSDGGSGQAACSCGADDVCFEQLGGPVHASGPELECGGVDPGTGDPCTRVQGEGQCSDSSAVRGLCLCNDGAL